MSMLAEPRRKQKWTLNPRGKQWSEDPNKFGQKMLEKMGWTAGKGLGANEQGMTEHVRVSVKDDTAGIGFRKDDLDKAWTEHQDSFNGFLQELQKAQTNTAIQTEESTSELSGKSLELKSKQSRARVHYHKFTRGKDVNKYSSKDLANIFGQKELNADKETNNTKEEQDNGTECSDAIGTQENRGGVITIHGGNMAEYFMRKSQDYSSLFKKNKRQRTESESEPEYAGFGFSSASNKEQLDADKENNEAGNTSNYAFENPCLRLNSPETVSEYSGNAAAAPKRKVKFLNSNEIDSYSNSKQSKAGNVDGNAHKNGIENAALNLECQAAEACNGAEFEVSRTQFGLTNNALDLSDEAVNKKRVTFNDHVEYSTDSVKRKKGKATLDKFEVENKKLKRKRKHDDSANHSASSGFINQALDVEETSAEMNDNEINERKSRKSKKRKESRRSNLETIMEIPEEDKVACEDGVEIKRIKIDESVSDNFVPKENANKKKKKKEKKEIIVIDLEKIIEKSEDDVIIVAELNTAKEDHRLRNNEDEENISKEKKKKKKKRKSTEPNEESCGDTINEIKLNDTITDDTVKDIRPEKEESLNVNKKKKKSKKGANTVDVSQETIENVSIKEDENTLQENTPNIKTKKEKHEKSIDKSSIKDEKETTSQENTDSVHEVTPKLKTKKKKSEKSMNEATIKDENGVSNKENTNSEHKRTAKVSTLNEQKDETNVKFMEETSSLKSANDIHESTPETKKSNTNMREQRAHQHRPARNNYYSAHNFANNNYHSAHNSARNNYHSAHHSARNNYHSAHHFAKNNYHSANHYVKNNYNSQQHPKPFAQQRNPTHQNKTPNNSSHWQKKAKLTKKILLSLFQRNSIAEFPGSNMKDIHGYGVQARMNDLTKT